MTVLNKYKNKIGRVSNLEQKTNELCQKLVDVIVFALKYPRNTYFILWI